MSDRAFMFASDRPFRLVVFAPSITAARKYLKSQRNCRAHRALKFLGQGEPTDPEKWVAARVDREGGLIS